MMFKECTGKWYFKNGRFENTDNLGTEYLKKGKSYYEVLRIIEGKPLFLADHLLRLKASLKEEPNALTILKNDFEKAIGELAKKNIIKTGNVKIVINISESVDIYMYFIPHRYPGTEQYENGIDMLTARFERNHPSVKAVNLDLREKTETLIIENKIYEVLLVNDQGYITEGSKSNIFFIKNNQLFTPPINEVLAGITRKYVIYICHQGNLTCYEDNISITSLSSFESAFITGTSPKILPVKKIDVHRFNVNHPLLRHIMNEYDKILDDFVTA